jgi:hypothetical protein
MATILPSSSPEAPVRHKRPQLSVAAVLSVLAVAGRVLVAPLLLSLVFAKTAYLTGGKVLIESHDSYFAFSEMDRVMIGGCTDCNRSCARALLHFSAFGPNALLSKPTFQELQATATSPETQLGQEVLALADALEANQVICSTGFNEWGSPHTVVSGEAHDLLCIITTLKISVAPRMIRELELGIEDPDSCRTKWSMNSILRRYLFQTTSNSLDYSSVPAADFSVFPDYTECRPEVATEALVGSKLALATNGVDRIEYVPDLVDLFPFDFASSLAPAPQVIPAGETVHGARTVMQPSFRAYFAGCRVREVNATGIFVEAACVAVSHWELYGLMLQAPDELPVCSTENICIHNYYNSLWEWVTQIDPDVENRVVMKLNVFRNRFGDTVNLSVLPGMVVVQMLLMGIVSCYQVMSQKRSVLLTQIWAYRCQNGRMQVLYFAQVTYHLVSNSDIYYLGLATGTLTVESVANLTFCFFSFSYSFVNMVKARSGEQKLARHFRLAWEITQLLMVTCVAATLYAYRLTSLSYIIDANGELLRKTSSGGAALCKLRDSCLVFTYNLALVLTVVSFVLGSVAGSIALVVHKRSQYAHNTVDRASIRSNKVQDVAPIAKPGLSTKVLGWKSPRLQRRIEPSQRHGAAQLGPPVVCIPRRKSSIQPLTSFEQHCLGVPFARLFTDCGDIAYMKQRGVRCSTVEAVLLTGFLFYGKHVYQAQDVVILLLARMLPRRVIRTFNVLLLRWTVDPVTGRVSFPESCSWYAASEEHAVLAEVWPIA